MLHKRCNTDVLGVLLLYPHSPLSTARPWDRVYISVKPLTAMLQSIIVYVAMWPLVMNSNCFKIVSTMAFLVS